MSSALPPQQPEPPRPQGERLRLDRVLVLVGGLVVVAIALVGPLSGLATPPAADAMAAVVVVVILLFQSYSRVLAALATGEATKYADTASVAPSALPTWVIPAAFIAGIALGHLLWL